MAWLIAGALLIFFLFLKFPLSFFLRMVPKRLFLEYRVSGSIKHRGFVFFEKFKRKQGRGKGVEEMEKDELIWAILSNIKLEKLGLKLYLDGENLIVAMMGGGAFAITANTLLAECRRRWERAELTFDTEMVSEGESVILAEGEFFVRGINLVIIFFKFIAIYFSGLFKSIKKKRS